MLTYEPLRILMVKRNIKKMEFADMVGITPPTLSKLMQDKPVTLEVLDRVCETLDVELHEVIRRRKKDEGV
ncbi:helix-turn-helix transcriptional regulator [Paenibacillus macerans]|uniref:helix-turn-helix domain-containing protein n=1 Tax=Paenibacillus macerans TaxID=44252 RepID=UPI002DB7729B|nr:helix-turn-helix transcriptional regulator [Paenibacillus macerans]MEC0136146.1 helix-turn-helix transcriptional regulator [Paenibacillus macerans]